MPVVWPWVRESARSACTWPGRVVIAVPPEPRATAPCRKITSPPPPTYSLSLFHTRKRTSPFRRHKPQHAVTKVRGCLSAWACPSSVAAGAGACWAEQPIYLRHRTKTMVRLRGEARSERKVVTWALFHQLYFAPISCSSKCAMMSLDQYA